MPNRFKRQRAKASNPDPAAAAAAAIGDEDDYLSASFVAEVPNKPRGKRSQQTADPERGRVLSKKDIAKKMEDRREEGLQQKIGEENAGFKLLMKLGYKGGGLGKDGSGTTKPLMPELKDGRAGLGRESEAKRRKNEQKERARQKAARDAQQEVQRRERFQLSKAAQFAERRLQQDLNRARRLVESLDESAGKARCIMWPDEMETLDDDDDDDDDEHDVSTAYERSSRGGLDEGGSVTAGSGTTVLAAAAAAGGAATRCEGKDKEREDGMDATGDLREEWELMTADEKLSACLAYLRASYSYCMYCACQYNGPQDLRDSCPGPSRDDHDDEEL